MNFQAPETKNIYGHFHDGKKTHDGYGLCSFCGSRENTDEYQEGCNQKELGVTREMKAD